MHRLRKVRSKNVYSQPVRKIQICIARNITQTQLDTSRHVSHDIYQVRFQVVTLDTKHDCVLALQSAENLPTFSRKLQPSFSRQKVAITFCMAPHPTIFQCLSITLIIIYKKLNTESLHSILKLTSYLSLVAICNCSSGLRASPKILSLASAYSCSLWNKTTNRHPSQCCLCCPLTPGTRTQNLLVRWGAMRNIMLPSIQHRQCHREACALCGLQTVQS